MYGMLDISVSGMIAQRDRQAVIAANIAGQNVLLDAQGRYNPYRRKSVMLAPGDPTASTPQARALGVHVARIDEDRNALRAEWDPESPYRDKDGNVMVPDISSVVENTNAAEAIRAYEANVAAAEVTKQMVAQSLRLIA